MLFMMSAQNLRNWPQNTTRQSADRTMISSPLANNPGNGQ